MAKKMSPQAKQLGRAMISKRVMGIKHKMETMKKSMRMAGMKAMMKKAHK